MSVQEREVKVSFYGQGESNSLKKARGIANQMILQEEARKAQVRDRKAHSGLERRAR